MTGLGITFSVTHAKVARSLAKEQLCTFSKGDILFGGKRAFMNRRRCSEAYRCFCCENALAISLLTFFFPGVTLGTIHNKFRCEDIENQTFADESFDIVITQDVMQFGALCAPVASILIQRL